MKNEKGFTLIEIIAVIVIIAVGGTIAIVAVSQNIVSSRDDSVVDLAKNYMESARSMRGKDEFYYEPKKNEAIVVACDSLTGTEIEHKDTTGYGKLLSDYCYVGVTNDGNSKFSYYMTMADETYHILAGVDYNKISTDDILIGSDKLATISSFKTPLSGFSVKYDGSTYTIQSVRMKYTTSYNDGGVKNTTLYGQYANDGSQASVNAAHKGTITQLDTLMNSNNKTFTYNGKTHTITSSEILYIVVKK